MSRLFWPAFALAAMLLLSAQLWAMTRVLSERRTVNAECSCGDPEDLGSAVLLVRGEVEAIRAQCEGWALDAACLAEVAARRAGAELPAGYRRPGRAASCASRFP